VVEGKRRKQNHGQERGTREEAHMNGSRDQDMRERMSEAPLVLIRTEKSEGIHCFGLRNCWRSLQIKIINRAIENCSD
jgi:seryl-tRNA(Sec) selenium transferase